MMDFHSLKGGQKDRIGCMFLKFEQFEISPPQYRNSTTPPGENMISVNCAPYDCYAHQMKGIEEKNTSIAS